jgi:hypothetical protein
VESVTNTFVYDLFPKSAVIDEIKKKGPEAPPDYQRYETLFVNQDNRKIYLGFSISPLTAPDALIGYLDFPGHHPFQRDGRTDETSG